MTGCRAVSRLAIGIGLTAAAIANVKTSSVFCDGGNASLPSSEPGPGATSTSHCYLLPPAASINAPFGGPSPDKKSPDPVEQLLEKYGPLMSQVGFGSIAGYTSGYALKKIGQSVAFATGCLFLCAQGLAYCGYVDIKWNRVMADAKNVLDADGDGKVDKDDLIIYWKKIKSILTYNLPSSGGFSLGFLYGLSA